MTGCEETRSQMMFYLDDELQTSECRSIEAHLNRCDACRALFENERGFLARIRESRPQAAAPGELRTRIEKLLSTSAALPPTAAPTKLRHRVLRVLKDQPLMPSSTSVSSIPRWALVFAVILAVVLAAALWRQHSRTPLGPSVAASDFAEMAVETHQRHVLGHLPLEIASDMPGQISEWFTGKVPFLLKLPNYQESSGQEKLYRLEGARLVSYRNNYAAYVAYQMHSRPISLVVTSDAVAKATGGEQIVAKEITFHYNSIKGLKVITWSDRGLTYALVSNLEERGQESCIVCHQGTKDRDFIESLKPR